VYLERPLGFWRMLLGAGLAKVCKGFLICILEDTIFQTLKERKLISVSATITTAKDLF